MTLHTRAWIVCDKCKGSTRHSGAETVAEARGDVKRLGWGRSLKGKRGDYCRRCKHGSKVKSHASQ